LSQGDMRLQPETWGIASGEATCGKTIVAGCFAAMLQAQSAPAILVDADLARQNFLVSGTVNSAPDVLFTQVLSEGYLSVLRRSLGDEFDRTLRHLLPALQGRQRSTIQLLLDFGSGPSAKYAEFFPLVSNQIVVVRNRGESIAKALSFAYRAILRCIGRRLHSSPDVMQLLRRALRRESEGELTRLSEIAYHLIGINRHAAEVARSIIRSYRPKIVLNRMESPEDERRIQKLLAEIRVETDLEIAYGGSLPNEPRFGEIAEQFAKLSIDDPESEYAIWIAREFARRLQGVSEPDASGPPSASKPGSNRTRFLGGLLGALTSYRDTAPATLRRQEQRSADAEGQGARLPINLGGLIRSPGKRLLRSIGRPPA
jgi:MinD-like ATPase involved in chromosome partitioning or flagellar assembly